MAKELEIKLSLKDEHTSLAWDWLIARAEATVGESRRLRNVYYDTPEGSLNQRKVALRVRETGSGFIQTLKTRGEFVEGVHRRNEWEWPVEKAELDLTRIEGLPALEKIDPGSLKPVFETNFTRRIVMLESGGDVIEVAFDHGEIIAGGQRQALNEIEFELKRGASSSLLEWAVDLAQGVPVFLNVISKAEQGYHLGGVRSARPGASGRLSVNDFLSCLSACWLWRQSFPMADVDLSGLHQLAGSVAMGKSFQELVAKLSSGQPVNELIAGGLLGHVQLALAKVKPT